MRGAAEVVAVHGWGFHRSCWGPWRKVWEPEARFQAADRGYFGAPEGVRWWEPDAGPRVLLAHSMGLLLCPPELLRGAHAVVLFSSFLHFHPEGGVEERRSRRVLQRMRARLDTEPRSVLKEFYERSGLPAGGIAGDGAGERELHVRRLQEDLELLGRARFDPDTLAHVRVAVVLHGMGDRIVAPELGRALQRALPRAATFHQVEGAGHGLPFTHLQETRPLVERAVDALASERRLA